jgi:hypothetical protein
MAAQEPYALPQLHGHERMSLRRPNIVMPLRFSCHTGEGTADVRAGMLTSALGHTAVTVIAEVPEPRATSRH